MPTSYHTLISQLLLLPKLPLVVNELQNYIEKENKNRIKFYESIEENRKMEFINGEIYFHSPAMMRHLRIISNLSMLMHAYVVVHNIGFVAIEKALICFLRNDYEPDLCFWKIAKSKKFDDKQMRFPVPDLVVEVLSKSTEKNDRGIKFDDYEAHGVQEYWIVDADKKTIEQYILIKKKYQLQLKSTDGLLKSKSIKGFCIPIQAIFDEKISIETLKKI
jgi:Uma2 family endonuclease